jgi:peptide/nickel transport system permease protein
VSDAHAETTAYEPFPPEHVPLGEESVLTAIRSNLWLRFIVKRLLSLVAVFVCLVVGVFFMLQLIPGDPVTLSVGTDSTPQVIARMKHDYGFDKPVLTQFWNYVKALSHGDMGKSFQTQQPVAQLIRQRSGPSLQLAGFALGIVLLLSIPLGLIAGAFTREGRHRRLEVGFVSVTGILGSIPELVVATIFVYVFAIKFRLLPAGGGGSFKQLILPAAAIALPATMTLSRIVRVETLNVLAQDYMRTARSKWLPGWRVYFVHVLPNVLTATLTVAGLLFAGLVGGAVIAETLFARPGLGQTLVDAILRKEYVVAQGIILVIATAVVVVNALVDVLLALLDPRSLARHS